MAEVGLSWKKQRSTKIAEELGKDFRKNGSLVSSSVQIDVYFPAHCGKV